MRSPRIVLVVVASCLLAAGASVATARQGVLPSSDARVNGWHYRANRESSTQMIYPLLEDPIEDGWTALQSWNPEGGFGALLAFRGGVTIDGQNDDIGQVDEGPTGPAYFDAADPTFTKPTSFLNWEQVSGNEDNGSLVYMFEMKNANSLVNPLVVPYYRDDACLDDGTGDNPSPRPWPGEAQTDSRLAEYRTRPCYGDPSLGAQYSNTADPAIGYKQGCFGCHGIHYFVTGDTDNAMAPVPVTEIDGQQWQWMVPTAAPANVGDAYANTVKVPLIATATSL